jgi:hypothetical protein
MWTAGIQHLSSGRGPMFRERDILEEKISRGGEADHSSCQHLPDDVDPAPERRIFHLTHQDLPMTRTTVRQVPILLTSQVPIDPFLHRDEWQDRLREVRRKRASWCDAQQLPPRSLGRSITRGTLGIEVLVATEVAPNLGELTVSVISIAELQFGILAARTPGARANRQPRRARRSADLRDQESGCPGLGRLHLLFEVADLDP